MVAAAKFWHDHAPKSNRDIQSMYEQGFVGAALPPPWVKEELHAAILERGGQVEAADACGTFGLAGSHAGELVLPYLSVLQLYPGSLPGPGQDVGDCVSQSTKNAILVTHACEVTAAAPDEVTGKMESAVEISDTGIRNGVFSTEAIYWWRRHSGHGWFCPDACKVAMNESGAWVRKDYPELGIDLTEYSGRLASKYGRTPPTGDIAEAADDHLVRNCTECSSFEEIRDLLGNGYGITSCGSEGFASTRDEWGVARKQGSWAHAMCYSSDTEILTDSGWKSIETITTNTTIATLNQRTHNLEWEQPSRVTAYRHRDKLLHFTTRGLDLLVTPNHRMYGIKNSRHQMQDKTSTDSPCDYEFIRADEVSKSFLVKRNAGWQGAVVLSHEMPHGTRVDMNVWLEFLGYYLTEGSSYYREYARVRDSGNTVTAKVRRITIDQQNEEGVKVIGDCLRRMPYRFRRRKNAPRWDCEHKELHAELAPLGRSWEKRIPSYVWECCREQLLILFDAMMLGDGAYLNGQPHTYTTTSKEMADDFQRLLLHIGLGGKVTKGKPSEWGKRPRYTVTIRKSHDLTRVGEPVAVDYDDWVHCPTTQNGVVFVRRNGKAVWCGNSYIGADDRPETHSKYGGPLVLVQNSWGSGWISGPRRIHGTDKDIPEGSFWARWSDLKRRYAAALSGHNGWPRQQLPDWGWAF